MWGRLGLQFNTRTSVHLTQNIFRSGSAYSLLFYWVSPWLLSCTAWRAKRCGVRQPQSLLSPVLAWHLDTGGGTLTGRTALLSVMSHQTVKHFYSKSGATRTSRSICVSQSSVWESSTQSLC